jgi:hypothetical protein
MKKFAHFKEKEMIDSLIDDATASDLLRRRSVIARLDREIKDLVQAVKINETMDLNLVMFMINESGGFQINYIDVGGHEVLAADSFSVGDERFVGQAGEVHPTRADARIFAARIGQMSANQAIMMAGHCRSTLKVGGDFVTANPGAGNSSQIVDFKSGQIFLHEGGGKLPG